MKNAQLTLTLCILTASAALAKFPADGPMEIEKREIVDKQIPDREMTLHPRMAELMGWAIAQPDELTVLSGLADTGKMKITDLSPAVTKLLEDPRPLVRTTAIQTVSALDAKQSADSLLKFVTMTEWKTQQEQEQTERSDALLARWADARGVKPWTARLSEAKTLLPLRMSAARALAAGVNGDEAATRALSKVAMDDAEPMPLRLVASHSLGAVQPAKLEDAAEQLMARGLNGRLLSPLLLHRHAGERALKLLTTLANDDQPAVQAPAMQRLLETEPQRLWPTAEKLVASPDPKVRLLLVKACEKWHDSHPVLLLTDTLDDPHPLVRNEARVMLRTLAKQEKLNGPIKAGLRAWIARGVEERGEAPAAHWRAAEQAAKLAGELDDKPANADLLRLVETLEHPRLEVRLAAVASIRTLALPESRKPITSLVERVINRIEKRAADYREKQSTATDKAPLPPPDNEPDSHYLAEAAQTMGTWGVTESDPILRRLIPKKHPAHPRARASAIWSLGLLHAGKPEQALAKELEARLYDTNPLDPEAHEVRLHSALAIGRMKALFERQALMLKYEQDSLEIRAACRWAVMHMTGETLPALTLEPGQLSDGFIQPLD